MTRVRLLDFGSLSALRSQTFFHAVAEKSAPAALPTLCLSSPDRPYVSLGYHQDAAREMDLEFCRREGIPVLRRRIGGGAVLLDGNQLFFHLIVPREWLREIGISGRLDRRYERLTRPAIAAYRALGVAAEFRAPNDIHVGGRKICGTGAADIGESFVFVGSLIADFDHALMARVLRFEDEFVRARVRTSMEESVTSLRHETGDLIPTERLRDALLEGFRNELGVELVSDEPRSDEEAEAHRLDALFASEEWLHRISAEDRPRRLTINSAVRFLETERGWLMERTA